MGGPPNAYHAGGPSHRSHWSHHPHWGPSHWTHWSHALHHGSPRAHRSTRPHRSTWPHHGHHSWATHAWSRPPWAHHWSSRAHWPSWSHHGGSHHIVGAWPPRWGHHSTPRSPCLEGVGRDLSCLVRRSSVINQLLHLLFQPLLVEKSHILFVFSAIAMSLSHRRRVVCEICVTVITVILRHRE